MQIKERFIDEDLAPHWKVDGSRGSFEKLLEYLEKKTNTKSFFEEALSDVMKDFGAGRRLIAADIGAGVGWASALMAGAPSFEKIYSVDPSVNRLGHAENVITHFGVAGKVQLIRGDFLEPYVPEKVDLVVLCSSLHHCYDEQIPGLFRKARELLKPDGRVLIANEHYVGNLWMIKRAASYLKKFKDRKELFYYPLSKLRSPHPFDGEHWRTRKEIEKIFSDNGFRFRISAYRGRLDTDNSNASSAFGVKYYRAVLRI